MNIRSMYPRLVVSDAAKAIDFYAAAFGAQETARHTDPATGKIVHAMVTIGDIEVAVKDEDSADRGPTSIGGSPVILALTVDDPDAVAAAMERGGATVVYPVEDRDYGSGGSHRGGRLADPFGHLWMLDQQLS